MPGRTFVPRIIVSDRHDSTALGPRSMRDSPPTCIYLRCNTVPSRPLERRSYLHVPDGHRHNHSGRPSPRALSPWTWRQIPTPDSTASIVRRYRCSHPPCHRRNHLSYSRRHRCRYTRRFDMYRWNTRCWDPTRADIPASPIAGAVSAVQADMHVPLQALSQQTPSTQLPLIHSFPPPQRAPIALRHSLPVLFIHVPSVLHTCGVVPTHWRRPGTH